MTDAAVMAESPGVVGLQWWDHQRRWLDDPSRLRVCCKARQIGMSTVLAGEALHAAVYGETTVIVSASQRQASELLRKAAHLLPLVNVAGGGALVVTRQSAEEIELSTGGRVISLPSAAATVQGYTGHVVIDEAAWIPDVETLWMAIVPTISTRGDYRLSVVSTPGPQSGMFYRLWTGTDPSWSRHRISIYDAKEGGAPHDVEMLRAAVADDTTWRMAYECQFVDEATAFLSLDLIRSCESVSLDCDLDWQWLANTTEAVYVGFDIGRKRDLSVLWIASLNGDRVLSTRAVIVMRGVNFTEQEETLYRVLERGSVRRCCIDSTGLGMQLAERAVERWGEYRVEAVNFTIATKARLGATLKRRMQDAAFRIPADERIRRDLHSVGKYTSAGGNVRLLADNTDDGHADRFWAAALCCEAAEAGPPLLDCDYEHVPISIFARMKGGI
ncbi:MAG: hypothetical protein HOP29_13930 [Phycisphaerales bacterium]|nr:hypothetical protein [Phycisphaerales bacterium]